MNELQTGIEPALTVLPQPAVLLQPGKAALDHPALRHALECVQLAPLGNLHTHLLIQRLAHCLGERRSQVAAVAQHAFDLPEARLATLKRLQRPLAVRDLGCRHSHHVRQALRVHHDMALDAGGLSARVIAFKPCRVRALHAMRVNDEKAATGVAPLFLAARANLIFSKPAPAGLVFRAARSGYSVRVHGAAPLRKVLGLHAPLEATPEQVEHCAKHLVEVNPPWAGLLARTPQQRLDDLKLRSADIARMALSPPPTPSHASMGDFEHALSAVVHAAPQARPAYCRTSKSPSIFTSVPTSTCGSSA